MRQILRIPSDSLSRRTSSSTSRRSAYLPLISGIPEILHNSAVPGLLRLLPVEPAPAPLVELVAVGHRVSVIDGDEEEGVPLGCAAFSADHDVGVVAVGVHQIHVQKGDFLDFKSAKFGRGPVGNEVCVLHEFLQRTDLVAEVRMALREKGVANVGLHERKSKGPTWTVLGTAKMWPWSTRYAATSRFQPSPDRIPLRKPLCPVTPWKLPGSEEGERLGTRIVLGEGLFVFWLEDEKIPLVAIFQKVGSSRTVQRQLRYNAHQEGISDIIKSFSKALL